MKVETFKDLLKNYYKLQASLVELRDKERLLLYQEANVKGVNPQKEPSHPNPSVMAEIRLDLVEQREEIEKEIDFTVMAINFISFKLSKLDKDKREMCLRIAKQTYESMADEYNFTSSGLFKHIESELKKIL